MTPDSSLTPAALVREVDIADGLDAISTPQAGVEAFVLVRLFTEPIGTVSPRLTSGGIPAEELAKLIASELGESIGPRLLECGLPWTGDVPVDGLHPPRRPAHLVTREHVLRDGPQLTIAVCTRGHAPGLQAAIASICAQRYEKLRILVVDNAPEDAWIRDLVERRTWGRDIRYAVEPRPGLSWARNRSVALADGDVIAWVDDDAVCDVWWAAELARAFVEVKQADAVTGPTVPTELQTSSQLLFEQYASVRRSRGFSRAIFSPETRALQSPLYPSPPFGIGANMAFRLPALKELGGFDPALGAGTLTRTGEDTAALSALLLAGGTIVWQPTAVMRHDHRRDAGVLRAHLRGHGRGVGAFYASMLTRQPGAAMEVVSLVPKALRDQFSMRSQRMQRLDASFPKELLWSNRIGILEGPFAYAQARRRARRLQDAVSA